MKYFYQPVKPFSINQTFSEKKACVSTDGTNKVISKSPYHDSTVCPVGYKELYGDKGHLGTDIQTYHGQEVYCIQKGVVNQIDTNPKSGLDVRIITQIDGRKFKHIYEHLLGYQCKVGDVIETGQLVGWADNTGYSSGDHLHLQLEEMVGSTWVPINAMPLMEPRFAKDILAINNRLKYLQEQVALLADRIASWLRTK